MAVNKPVQDTETEETESLEKKPKRTRRPATNAAEEAYRDRFNDVFEPSGRISWETAEQVFGIKNYE